MEKETARVSVVMCTYNGAAFLREQLDSILAQDYPLHEILVQDDCSTDDTPAILAAYAARDSRMRVHRNTERMGFNRNFHTAMMRATGDFIAIADQDDIWFPQKIRRQMEAIGPHDVCFSAYYRDAHFSARCTQLVQPSGRMEHLLFHNVIPGHTMLVRRRFAAQAENWNDGFYYDWWFLVMAHLQGNGVARVDEALNWHRPHAASAIARLRSRAGVHVAGHPTWQPYVYGWSALRKMRRSPAWQMFYRHIQAHTSATHFPLVHRLSSALLQPKALPRLCWLCYRHRATVYPASAGAGWKGRLRGACFPAIYAYGNTAFYL